MGIWILIFVLVFLASLVMAYRSMSDYYEQASHFPVVYSHYLVGKPDALTEEVIQDLYQSAFDSHLILSFERLFKGSKRALVIFGPTTLMHSLMETLKLTEIEDYSLKTAGEKGRETVITWGASKKKGSEGPLQAENLFEELPEFLEDEEFWWQVVVQPKGRRNEEYFESIIRVVLLAQNPSRGQSLKEELIKIGQDEGLAELPKAHTTDEFLKLYQERALPKEYTMTIKSEEVLSLVEA